MKKSFLQFPIKIIIVEQNWFAKIRNAVETSHCGVSPTEGCYMFLYVNVLRMHSETPQCDVSTKKQTIVFRNSFLIDYKIISIIFRTIFCHHSFYIIW